MDTLPVVTSWTPDTHTNDLVEAVVGAVADAENVPPMELPPLGAVVDTEHVAALFRGSGRDGTIEFGYHGYRVSVSGDGDVVVRADE